MCPSYTHDTACELPGLLTVEVFGSAIFKSALAGEYSVGLLQVWLPPGMFTDSIFGEYSVGLLLVWLPPGMVTDSIFAAALLTLGIS